MILCLINLKTNVINKRFCLYMTFIVNLFIDIKNDYDRENMTKIRFYFNPSGLGTILGSSRQCECLPATLGHIW